MGDPKRMATWLTQLFVMLAETFLGLRVLFSLFNGDVTNSFVRWVYTMTETLLAPLRGLFPPESFDNSYVLEFRVLFAMVAYAFVGYLVLVWVDKLPKPRLFKVNVSKIFQQ